MGLLPLYLLIAGGGLAGHKGLSILGDYLSGQRNLTLGREQIASKEKLAASEMEGKRRSTSDSREASRRYMEMVLEMDARAKSASREERSDVRKAGYKDRQMQMIMAAMQMASSQNLGSGRGPSMGMLSSMRGE